MRKTRLMLAALVVVVMAALTAGCGKSNTPTAVKATNQTVNLDTAIDAPAPNFSNVSTATAPNFDNNSTASSGGGGGASPGEMADNTSSADPGLSKTMSLETNPIYEDQNVEAGRNNVRVASFIHYAGDKDWNNTKYVVDFYSVTEYRQITLKNVYVKTGGNVLPSVDYVSFDSRNHTPSEYYDGSLIPKGTAVITEVFASMPTNIPADTQFYVTVRAVGSADGEEVRSTDEIYGQVMTFAKGEASLIETENNSDKGAVAGTEMIAGTYSINSALYLALASMEFTVDGKEAVEEVKVYEPQQSGYNLKLLGSAVPVEDEYTGKAIINFSTPVAMGGIKKFITGVKLNDKAGMMVSVRLTRFTTINAAGELVTYTVDSQGNWVRTVKSVPTLGSQSLPTNNLVYGLNTVYRLTIWANGSQMMGWKQSPAFTLKHRGLEMDFFLKDESTGTYLPVTPKITETTGYNGIVTTTINFETIDEQAIYHKTYAFVVEVKRPIDIHDYLISSVEMPSTNNVWVSSGRYQDYADSTAFVWSDRQQGHSLDSYDWYNGMVRGQPPQTYTLSVQPTP